MGDPVLAEKERKIIVIRLVLVFTVLTLLHLGMPILIFINRLRGIE